MGTAAVVVPGLIVDPGATGALTKVDAIGAKLAEKDAEARHADERATRAERDAQTAHRGQRAAQWAGVAAALIVGAVAIVITVHGQTTRADDIASLAATGQVASARAESLGKERRDFTNIDAAMRRAGLPGCPDPGPAANAYQVSSTVGDCSGTLRTLGELEKRGVLVPGVRAPDPSSGEFPQVGHVSPG